MLKQMKYALLTKLRNPSIVFWPFLFPLALATLMYFAIGQMDQADFETVAAMLPQEILQYPLSDAGALVTEPYSSPPCAQNSAPASAHGTGKPGRQNISRGADICAHSSGT